MTSPGPGVHAHSPDRAAVLPDAPWHVLLLDLVSPARPVSQARLDALTPADWQALLELARLHRLLPLLHWQLSPGQAHAHLVVGPEVRAELARGHRQSTLRSLALQRELVRLHRLLAEAGLPHVALKGAYLAWHAYPQPALRPLRDLDLLVPRAQALDAHALLMAQGGLVRWTRGLAGTPEAALTLHRHLPALCTPNGQVVVELHARIFHLLRHGQAVADLSERPDFWPRCVRAPLGGEQLAFESPTDLLLHLIVHAVHDHGFDNGPLLLSDLAFLLRGRAIDWPLFWRLAEEEQCTRACRLALRLTERHWGPQPVDWSVAPVDEEAIDDRLMETAALLMLRDHRGNQNIHTELSARPSWGAKVAWLCGKLFPTRAGLSTLYPVRAQSAEVFLWYPVNWWRLLSRRLPAYRRARRQRQFQGQADRLAVLAAWLTR